MPRASARELAPERHRVPGAGRRRAKDRAELALHRAPQQLRLRLLGLGLGLRLGLGFGFGFGFGLGLGG